MILRGRTFATALCVSMMLSNLIARSAFAFDSWEANAYSCKAPDGTVFPSKGSCDDGDSTLFNGILCDSGDSRGCDAVRDSFTQLDQTHGRFWRSPRAAQTNNDGKGASDPGSFSPDQELGVLLYAWKTKDSTRLIQWFNTINDSRSCAFEKPKIETCSGDIGNAIGKITGGATCTTIGGGCWYQNLPKYCGHFNCTLRPLDRDMDDAVFRAIVGGEPPDGIANYNQTAIVLLGGGSLATSLLVPVGVKELVETVVVFGIGYVGMSVGDKVNYGLFKVDKGFPVHLDAIRAHLLIEIGNPDHNKASGAITKIISQEPNNPFYNFLQEGPSARVSSLTRQYCPVGSAAAGSLKTEWMWEQANSQNWT